MSVGHIESLPTGLSSTDHLANALLFGINASFTFSIKMIHVTKFINYCWLIFFPILSRILPLGSFVLVSLCWHLSQSQGIFNFLSNVVKVCVDWLNFLLDFCSCHSFELVLRAMAWTRNRSASCMSEIDPQLVGNFVTIMDFLSWDAPHSFYFRLCNV